MSRSPIVYIVALGALALAAGSHAQSPRGGDWPQWRGPARDGHSGESGLLKSWPAGGPALLWTAPGIGGGFSTPTIAGGSLYGMGYRGEDEAVWALDAATGQGRWVYNIGPANRRVGYPEGPRCSPTTDGDRLYALGVSGGLVCLEAATGKLLWSHSLTREFGGSIPSWGYSESPLVEGNLVIATPGGRRATLVAFNKLTGAEAWRGQVPEGDGAHYASAIAATVGGRRQVIQFLAGGVVGLAADSGRFLWRWNRPANGTANCSTPIFSGDQVFAASGYNTGGGLVRLSTAGGDVRAEEVYFTRNMKNHHGGMILVGEYVYGFDDPGTLTCLRFTTGEVMWTNRSVGKGSLCYADGHLIARSERGPVALVEATHTGYVEKGRLEPPARSGHATWPHPVIAGGRLYLRDQDKLYCYDVRGR